MNLAALHHGGWLEYREALGDGSVRVRLKAARGDLTRATLLYAGIYSPERFSGAFSRVLMELAARDSLHDFFETCFRPPDPRVCYLFLVEAGAEAWLLDQDGVREAAELEASPAVLNPFPFAYVWPADNGPAWARGAVGYQIFPDRFRREGPSLPGLEPWTGTDFGNNRRFGGNLRGICAALPYLQKLGVEILYLTPLFISDTAHRYNVENYFRIDPLLGTLKDLRALSREVHRLGMRLVLDGVFNHCGDRFPPFQDALRRGKLSPFRDWFFFDDSPIGYQCFAFEKRMPKLNLKNPKAAAYFLKAARYWTRAAGLDGWRLDVSPEVWPGFWRSFRRTVLQENPRAILIAECWDEAREWVSGGDLFDGTMHYVFSRALWRFLTGDAPDLPALDAALNRALSLYPAERGALQWTFLSTHDTPRFLTRAAGREERLRMAAFLQFTSPGAPFIYYGDELGLAGGDDPDCRRPMPWDRAETNPLLDYFRRLARVRRALPTLREGQWRSLEAGPDGLYACLRTGDPPALCVLCTGSSTGPRPLSLPPPFAESGGLYDWMEERQVPVEAGQALLDRAPGRGWILTPAGYRAQTMAPQGNRGPA